MTETAGQERPAPERPRRPRRGRRLVAWTLVVVGYAALLWFVVFPWVDRTYVNRPTF